jgi:hypothetical protein
MVVSRKNKSMKKSSNKRKNGKSNRKTRKNIRKMLRGGVNYNEYYDNENVIVDTDTFKQVLDLCIKNNKSKLYKCLQFENHEVFSDDINFSYLLNDKLYETLELLNLDNHKLTKDNMNIISEFLTKSKKLHTLSLQNCFTTSEFEDFAMFFNAIGNNNTLKKLDITHNEEMFNINFEKGYYMYVNLEKNKSLETIKLDGFFKDDYVYNEKVPNKESVLDGLFYNIIMYLNENINTPNKTKTEQKILNTMLSNLEKYNNNQDEKLYQLDLLNTKQTIKNKDQTIKNIENIEEVLIKLSEEINSNKDKCLEIVQKHLSKESIQYLPSHIINSEDF